MLEVNGRIRKGRCTKQLIHRLRPGDIAVVAHPDLDSVVAEDLIHRGVRAVLNTEISFTGRFCTPGPRMLLDAGVALLDQVEEGIFDLPEGVRVAVRDRTVCHRLDVVASGRRISREELDLAMEEAIRRRPERLESFVDNTLSYARSEKDLLLEEPRVPPLSVRIQGRPVLVVVRGRSYRQDIRAIRNYVKEQNPIIIAVDGAADAVVAEGWNPHVLLGDMDSVSDRALMRVVRRGADLIVHAYPDGTAPGLKRLQCLGLSGQTFSVAGTSEDAALLLADLAGADLIVAVGTHTDPVEFLEKGRPGMASTVLVRLRVGGKLVDAKGVNRLYRTQPRAAEVALLLSAALAPILMILWMSPSFNLLLRLLALQFRMIAAGG